jgi:hypothetical protein
MEEGRERGGRGEWMEAGERDRDRGKRWREKAGRLKRWKGGGGKGIEKERGRRWRVV